MLSDSSCDDDTGGIRFPTVLPPLLELTLSMLMFSEMLQDITESLLSKLAIEAALSMEMSSMLA